MSFKLYKLASVEKKKFSENASHQKSGTEFQKTHNRSDRLQHVAVSLDPPCQIKRTLHWEVRHLINRYDLIHFNNSHKRQGPVTLRSYPHFIYSNRDVY